MRIVENFLDKVAGAATGFKVGLDDIERSMEVREVDSELGALAREASLDTEIMLRQDEAGWLPLDGSKDICEISRDVLGNYINISRIMYILNPLIRRSVTVQQLYVWGSGCDIKADDPDVQATLKDFFGDPKNQAVVGQSWTERERDQRIDGNQFFAFFLNKRTGRIRVRLVPVHEIEDIACNPDDAKEPWFYKRRIDDNRWEYLRDINYTPAKVPSSHKEETDQTSYPVRDKIVILHVKTGGLSEMKFGMPENTSVLPWAKAYKRILENFSTIIQAYARIAMKISGAGDKTKTAAAKSKLQTTISAGNTREGNPPSTTGAWMAAGGNVNIEPVKTANATTGPDEARALRSMVAAGTDTPEHFFGDSDIGNFATSTTLDRPTELKMMDRQNFWRFIILRICRHLIECSAKAPQGRLRQAQFKYDTERDGFDGQKIVTVTHEDKAKSLHVNVTFPSIVERNVTERVRAVVAAVTLNGSKAEGIFPNRALVARYLLEALGERDVDHIMKQLYPNEVKQGFVDPAEEFELEKQVAKGKADLGKAAMKQADAAMKKAEQPPAPVVAGANGNGRN